MTLDDIGLVVNLDVMDFFHFFFDRSIRIDELFIYNLQSLFVIYIFHHLPSSSIIFHGFSIIFHGFSIIFHGFSIIFHHLPSSSMDFPSSSIIFHGFSIIFHHLPSFSIIFHHFPMDFPSSSIIFPSFSMDFCLSTLVKMPGRQMTTTMT